MSGGQISSLVIGGFFALTFFLGGLLLWKMDVGSDLFQERDGWLWMAGSPHPVAPNTPEGRRSLSFKIGLVFMLVGVFAAVITLYLVF
ncbi:MAG: hypothetical protein LKJ86_02055 [Oscillibacter sp.]|nr:hypothetical protein [Oscillibacter sp.]